MNKLLMKFYEKSEIWFAVVLMIIYVIPAANLRGNYGDDSLWMMLFLLLLTLLITFFLCKNGLSEKYGLTSWPDSRKFLYFFPFIILISVNLWFGAKPVYSGMGQIFAVVSMILIGFLEEMVFRGFLFRAIEKQSLKRAIIISAVTFGIGHIINLFTGQASLDTIAQILYAIAIGFAFVMAFHRGKSMWPIIVTHSLVDVTSKFRNYDNSQFEPYVNAIYLIFLIAVPAVYAWYIYKKIDSPENSVAKVK